MKYTIFYSWQSDLPNNTNRGFIQDVIEKAIKDFQNNDRYELEPSIDRDTQNIPGSPNITSTIIEKIRTSDAFVADISIVTGDKAKGQRPSPNPNVMLELGYAIALLGWDRIILFCNEHYYHNNEDLPFDIRQHRQIKYSLKHDDEKAPVRNRIVKEFGKRLVELIEHGKSKTSQIKLPIITAEWSYHGESLEMHSNEIVSDSIDLKRADLPAPVEEEIESDIEKAKNLDGSFDPKWDKKLDTYLQQAEAFLNERKRLENTNGNIIINNTDRVQTVTLSVGNDGNAKATDIRINVKLPEWIIAFEDYPDVRHTKPTIPSPKRPNPMDIMNMSSFGILQNSNPAILNALNSIPKSVTSACYLDGNLIKFWADELLHKHKLEIKRNTFHMLASPDAPVGESIITAAVFCTEFDDWQEISLKVHIS